MPGRDSLYTAELAAEICRRIAEGESLREICDDENMPAASTICGWDLENREGFSEQYARAREAQGHHFADEIVGIADSVRHTESMVEVMAARLAVDTRKWAAGKLAPKRFGDHVDVNHDGQLVVKVLRLGDSVTE